MLYLPIQVPFFHYTGLAAIEPTTLVINKDVKGYLQQIIHEQKNVSREKHLPYKVKTGNHIL